jgi:hypothetical protein
VVGCVYDFHISKIIEDLEKTRPSPTCENVAAEPHD